MRCCFDAFSITLGTMIMAGCLVVAGIASIVFECLPSNPHTEGLRITIVVVAAVQTVCALLVFVGCTRRKASLLAPVVIYTILIVIALFVKVLMSIVSLIFPSALSNILVATPFSTVATAVVFLFFVWFSTVFNNCYKCLKDSQSLSEYGHLVA
ncbi:hypothetical protein PMAYCL1PPCAC_15280 [Pristionchus mayeri]|uniref:Uncharacterized protein n=1 Tax=Pristionchus mayeri TaxID=1317129 RepID=A0AAN5CIQ0_9BILA|nr:hypothetical protein PMAYCL1PPCAC_15280 [Pristionchus mayeri]